MTAQERERPERPESRFPPVDLPDSSYAVAVQRFCLDLPEAWEDYPWGAIVFKVGARMFASTGPSLPVSVTLKATPEDADVLTQLPHIRRARYIGRHGWVTVVIDDEGSLEHARELMMTSYELVRRSPGRRRGARRGAG